MPVCDTVQSALQAMSRAVYTFSRDHSKVHVILDVITFT